MADKSFNVNKLNIISSTNLTDVEASIDDLCMGD